MGGMGGCIFVVANRMTPSSTPFSGPSPRLCTRSESGLQPCKPIRSSVQMILVGGVSMLHDPGYGPGGGVEVVVDGWQSV